MTMHVKVAGVWREIDPPSVRVGGAWQDVQEGWVKVAGVWQQFYSGVVLPNPALEDPFAAFSSDFFAPYYTYAGLRVGIDGDIYNNNGTGWNVASESTQWLATADKGSAGNGDYECKLTGTGDTPSGHALNTWLDDTVTRQWSLSRTTIGSESFNGTLTVRKAGDASSEVSCSVTISVNVGTI